MESVLHYNRGEYVGQKHFSALDWNQLYPCNAWCSGFCISLVFYPVILHSSIRTNDSLARKESFFYAELKRLQSIIAELESGQQTFILLDEILKGTNSKDKQIGSIALLEQLVKYQSVGLIATHDLILGDLVRDYPENRM